jgi:hypothetical protein
MMTKPILTVFFYDKLKVITNLPTAEVNKLCLPNHVISYVLNINFITPLSLSLCPYCSLVNKSFKLNVMNQHVGN